MNWRLARLAALTTAALMAAPVVALGAGTSPVAVLGFEAIGLPDALANDVSEAVKSRIAANSAFTVVAGQDLMEVKLVFSCPDENPGCMAQAGKSLGATKLVYGNIRKTGSEAVVNIRLLDVNRGTIEGALSDVLPKRRDRAGLEQAAQRWIAKLTGAPPPPAAPSMGSIRVTSSVSGATVVLDGARAGVAGPGGLVLSDVSPGHHEVRLEKSGFGTARRDLEVIAGEERSATFTLLASESAAPPPESHSATDDAPATTTVTESDRPDGVHRVLRNTFWISLTLGLATGVVAGKFAYDVYQVNKDLDPYRRYAPGTANCPANSPSSCNLDGQPAPDLTNAQRQIVADKRASGDQAQTLQWTFLAITGVFGVTALASGIGYLIYGGHSDETQTASAASSLRLLPSVNASGGGMTALIEF